MSDRRTRFRLWPRRRRARLAASALMLVLAGLMTATGLSLAATLREPGNDPVAARVAEWGRDHSLGWLVTRLESWQYALQPPKTGGAPDTRLLAMAPQRVGIRSRMATPVTPALRGEGVFRALQVRHGDALMQVAYVRPDSLHSSYLAAVVWMSGAHTKLVLHPGVTDPGHLQRWKEAPRLTTAASSGLLGAFNSGFKLADSRGTFWIDGRASHPIVPGAASLVVYRDGHADIGSWGSEVTMTPQVYSIRQNLRLLVDHGRIAADIDRSVQSNWGATIGSAYYVWRSGIGVTATGDLVYVTGDSLSAKSLAGILVRAGAVRAMQLDINRLWPSFYYFRPGADGHLVSHKVIDFARPVDRYFQSNSRDFYAVLPR